MSASLWSKGNGVHYEKPISSGSLKGSFKLPRSAILALGDGDHELGLRVCDELFGHHLSLGRGTVHPEVINLIGEGDPKKGRAVLRKFVSTLKAAEAER